MVLCSSIINWVIRLKINITPKRTLKLNDLCTKQPGISPKTVSHSKRLILKDVLLDLEGLP